MKKLYVLFALLVSAASVNAQTFDETDLIGTWNTNGLAYPAYEITNIESITLGDCMYDDGKGLESMSGYIKNMTYNSYSYNNEKSTKTKEFESVMDFIISNNNKLHIFQADDFVLHFIIEELTSTTLKVKTYDGLSYTFTKTASPSQVKSVTTTRPADSATYNLQGRKVENIASDGIYIQNGQKKAVKK